MATCPNCKATLSCGCQKKKASDGKAVCNNCLSAYEKKLKGVTAATTKNVWQQPEQPYVPEGWKSTKPPQTNK